MRQVSRFKTETKTVDMGGRPVTLISRTPILSPQQREKRKQEVEAKLYDACIRHQRAIEQAEASKQNPS
jgi:hypothetical protein